jgi:thiamine biosynthesis protein ThiS
MHIQVNGKIREINAPSIEAVLEAESVPRADWPSVAVARNGSVVPKAEWNATQLANDDRIEIVRPFAGG